jgi:ATP-dependent DNA helicase RecG
MEMMFVESKQRELKRTFSESMLKTISAFSNDQGGQIIIGIDEKTKEIIHMNDEKELKIKIEHTINDTMIPRPRYQLNTIKIENKSIIEIVVYPGLQTPYLYKGIAYQRHDTSTVPVDLTSLVNLSLKGRNLTYDQMEVEETSFEFKVLEKKLIEVKSLSALSQDVLITLGLLKNNKYNIAAKLLADINNSHTLGIDIVRFGQNISEFVDRKTVFGMSILTQYDKAIDMFNKYYSDIEVIEGTKRIKKTPIPLEAFREALANAIAHRNYLMDTYIKIEMYDDRIVIISPGGLPEGLTKENYLKDYISMPRNILISQILYMLEIIEKFGTGIRRIKEAYSGFNVKPNFVIKDTLIKVILPNVLFNDEHMDDKTRIINLLNIKEEITRQDIETLLNVNKSKAVDIIQKLKMSSVIETLGNGKDTTYIKK